MGTPLRRFLEAKASRGDSDGLSTSGPGKPRRRGGSGTVPVDEPEASCASGLDDDFARGRNVYQTLALVCQGKYDKNEVCKLQNLSTFWLAACWSPPSYVAHVL